MKLGDILIVREYLDVFPDELPSVLIKREVEFGIDLIPSRQGIYQA